MGVDHDGSIVLCRDFGGGVGEARHAGDFQHGSRRPVHLCRVCDVLTKHEIRISMGARELGETNVFVKRLWCSVKYEEEAACLR